MEDDVDPQCCVSSRERNDYSAPCLISLNLGKKE